MVAALDEKIGAVQQQYLLAMMTLAPLWAAPKASALPAPPAPITTTVLPFSTDLFSLSLCPSLNTLPDVVASSAPRSDADSA